MSDDTEKRGPGRPKRADEVKERRRRRLDPAENGQGPLALNQGKMDKDYHYHWINDEPGRIHKMTVLDDYDKVEDESLVDEPQSEGSAVRRLVGAHKDGKPKYAYLCRKRMEYYTADRFEKQKTVNELEHQLKTGSVPGAKGEQGLSTDNPVAYVPNEMGSPVKMSGAEPRRAAQVYEP